MHSQKKSALARRRLSMRMHQQITGKRHQGKQDNNTKAPRPGTTSGRETLALLGRPGLKPFGMARRTEEFGFVIAPCFDGSFSVLRNRTTASALEMFFFGLAFRQELANQGQDNNANDCSSDDVFR
jgi:hypothetical protein